VKDTASGTTVNTLDVTNPSQVGLPTANQIDLVLATLQAGGTSSDLTSWNFDAAAAQSVTGTGGNVETVEVTLILPAPLAAPKLFVRVEAD
jgi:hypothetical protein